MNASQNKYVWGEIHRIAPVMQLSADDYKNILGYEVLKNESGSIKCSSTAAFLLLKERLRADAEAAGIGGDGRIASKPKPHPQGVEIQATKTKPHPQGVVLQAAGIGGDVKKNPTPNPSPIGRGTAGARLQADTMRKKLISMVYRMGWASAGDWRKALERIGLFVEGEKSIYKKPLMHHSIDELSKVVTQFEQMLKKHYASS